MKRFCFLSLLVASLSVASCLEEMDLPDYVPETPTDRSMVSVPLSIAEAGATRSSISPTEDKISNYSVFIYQKGRLARDLYVEGKGETSVTLHYDQTYNVYVVANMGDVTPPDAESEIGTFKYSVVGMTGLGEILPMSQNYGSVTVSDGTSMNFEVTRLVSKVTFSMDALDISGLNVESVRIRQTPLSVRPFSVGGSKAAVNEVTDGDYASTADITALQKNGTIEFYMFENMQGTLLADNTDPWEKIPDNIAAGKACTYIETVCRFDQKTTGREGTVTYRLFLGEDNITNFSVERNKIISVSLKATEDNLKKSSWKVVSDFVQHPTSVSLDKHEMTLAIGEKGKLTATVLPADAVDRSVLWESSDPRIASVDENGNVTPLKLGTCTITARSNDVRDLTDECEVTVKKANLKEISINDDDGYAYILISEAADYYDITATATFMDESTEAVAADVATYSSSDASIAKVNASGRVTAVSRGTATITVSYTLKNADNTTKTATDEIEVRVSSMAFDPNTKSLEVNDTFSPNINITTYDGNTVIIPVSDASSWSSTRPAVATVSDEGVITAVSPGTTSITGFLFCDYGWGYDSCDVTVINRITSIVLTPAIFSLEKTETKQIEVVGTYINGTTTTDASLFSWTSANTGIATVSATGIVTAVNTGTTTITASKDGVTASVSVTVKPTVTYTLTVSAAKSEIYVYDTMAATAYRNIYHDGVYQSSENVTSDASWESTNAAVATVYSGTVTGVSAGTANIKATYDGMTEQVSVTVKDKITYGYRFFISGYNTIVKGQDTEPYQVYYYQDTYTNGAITTQGNSAISYTGSVSWSVSSGTSYGSISAAGVLTGLGKGVVKICATLSHEGLTYNVYKEVTVNLPAGGGPDTGWEDGGDVDYN